MDSVPLVANGTRVGEIFTAAGIAFQKVGELAMLLQATRKHPSWRIRDQINTSLETFATDVEKVTRGIRKKTEEQMRGDLKRKYEEDNQISRESPVGSSKRRIVKPEPELSPAQQQLNGSLSEAERILAEADAERSAMLAGMPVPSGDGMLEDGMVVEEEIITTEPDDGAISDSGPVRGIGVAGSGESSSGEDDHVDPTRPKKRSKKRKTKRNEFAIGAFGVGDNDEDDHHMQQQHLQSHHHVDLVPDQQIDIGLEESVEVSQTEEEVVHDGLELQFAVSEEEVVTS